ncbi:cupin domain-containing protein [Fluviicola sp.]|uniref:cupin domain-containing protein n=1 Tax=Fluviicola sp. TaxID=1917219 RepID=UPI0031E31710
MKTKAFIRLVSSAKNVRESVMELNVFPGEKTPWHYHTEFSETFEVLEGTLEAGVGKEIYQLKAGDAATVSPHERHYYHNVSKEVCVIRVIIKPGNQNFEKALFILKGLFNDGLASKAGTPKKFSDLAVFVYLSNSRMLGFQKIAEPVFRFVARRAIKKGYLDALIRTYYL